MAIKLKRNADPLSFAARADTPLHPVGAVAFETILARSHASQVLRHELGRYCDGLVRGRSFLIAGHRGAGKTTLVEDGILHFQKEALKQQRRFKPLPVYVQGPLVFAENGRTKDEGAAPEGGSTMSNVTMAVAVAGGQPKPPAAPKAEHDDLERRVLIQVAQGLHQAVSMEFSERFHLHARRHLDVGAFDGDELAELAARFQIELTEAPPAARLQEFWRHAGLLRDGMLFDPGHDRGGQQGYRELIALNGVSHVFQRIAGTLEERDELKSGQQRSVSTQSGGEAKWPEFVRPLGALAAGGAVGGASALAGDPGWALLLGVVTMMGASLVFKWAGTTVRSRERKIDRTFLPDLSTKTLHRVMPDLFERLLSAGLAPVFIVDELDKVDDLYLRIHDLLNSLKKLFAERAFTCLLVDRGFYEQLHWREEQERAAAGGQPRHRRRRPRRRRAANLEREP